MAVYRFEASQLGPFISALAKRYQVFAPRRTDAVRFQEVEDASEIDLTGLPYTPPKSLFFDTRDEILDYDAKGISIPSTYTRERLLFGVRRCDLNAIAHQDIVYMQQRRDPIYAARREATTLIGLHCAEPAGQYCFCADMDLKDCQDLMFVERGSQYLVEANSPRGEALAAAYPQFFAPASESLTQDDRRTPAAARLRTTNIGPYFSDTGWDEGVEKCLSCGACTSLCPTCYCYEISDTPDIDNIACGTRCRSWSSCQLKEFTRVAGEHYFRPDRSGRFRHRIYHQMEYFRQRYGVNMCVGCGRCIAHCPTRIDWVDIVNRMVSRAAN